MARQRRQIQTTKDTKNTKGAGPLTFRAFRVFRGSKLQRLRRAPSSDLLRRLLSRKGTRTVAVWLRRIALEPTFHCRVIDNMPV